MTEQELTKRYLNWMSGLVYDDSFCGRRSYNKLLHQLYSIDFRYILEMDANRESDGIDLRYRFGYEEGYPDAMIATYLDRKPCSVLEMMISLAIRCEEIMEDPEAGDRTGQWFWNMVVNLGLGHMDNAHFDANCVRSIVKCFLDRDYGCHGEGGLFHIRGCPNDLRNVEIWYQMCWYLNNVE